MRGPISSCRVLYVNTQFLYYAKRDWKIIFLAGSILYFNFVFSTPRPPPFEILKLDAICRESSSDFRFTCSPVITYHSLGPRQTFQRPMVGAERCPYVSRAEILSVAVPKIILENGDTRRRLIRN